MSRNIRIFVLALIISALASVLCIYCECAFAVEAKAPVFVTELKDEIRKDNSSILPTKINGMAVEKLNGYANFAENIDKGRRLKGRVAGMILLYENILGKLNSVYSYGADSEIEVELERIFRKGLRPATTDEIMASSYFNLTDYEKAEAKKIVDDRIKLFEIDKFEAGVIKDKKISSMNLRIFYENTAKKLENGLGDLNKDIESFRKSTNLDFEVLAKRNILVEFLVSDKEPVKGIKKNFRRNDPYVVGIKYSSQGINSDIPAQWVIKDSDGRSTAGKVMLSGNQNDQFIKIASGKISDKAAPGRFDIDFIIYPATPDKAKHDSYFLVGNLPFKIVSVCVLDSNKKQRKEFKPGDKVLLAVFYQPYVESIEKAQFSWSVFDGAGDEVPSLSVSKELKLKTSDKNTQTKYISGVIPDEAAPGQFKFQAGIEAGSHEEFSDVAKFNVKSALYVKINASKATAKKGDKITFTPSLKGGEAPVKYSWNAGTEESSASQSYTVLFKKPGKYIITLTATDSAKPTPNKFTAKKVIEVTE